MQEQNHILEVALFTVKDEYLDKLPVIRQGVRFLIKEFPGLISIETYTPAENNNTFADIAKWETIEHAKAAAKAFESGDKRFFPYLQVIDSLKFMGHFKPEHQSK